ncbi:MAG TPA: hypothetical protein VFZ81_12790 [Burkholderiales bacterium]
MTRLQQICAEEAGIAGDVLSKQPADLQAVVARLAGNRDECARSSGRFAEAHEGLGAPVHQGMGLASPGRMSRSIEDPRSETRASRCA